MQDYNSIASAQTKNEAKRKAAHLALTKIKKLNQEPKPCPPPIHNIQLPTIPPSYNNSMSQELLKLNKMSSSSAIEKRPPGRPRKNTSPDTNTNDDTVELIKGLFDQQTNTLDVKLSSIVDTLKSFATSVNNKFSTIDAELRSVNNSIQKLNSTISSNSTQISDNTTQIAEHEQLITKLNTELNNNKELLDRMPNVIMFGIPEDPDIHIDARQRVVGDRELLGPKETETTDRLDEQSSDFSGFHTCPTCPETSDNSSADSRWYNQCKGEICKWLIQNNQQQATTRSPYNATTTTLLTGAVDCPGLLADVRIRILSTKLRNVSPFYAASGSSVSSTIPPLQNMINLTNGVCRKSSLFNKIMTFESISPSFVLDCVKASRRS
ncbi:uncharacterized protein LOC122850878 [Aphidius gifuensis]|uniref:uncharacterized protein LOC122850878 n=1 Tax=Aphidius gifuensis TaxID=684658 RepID=UPI001CDD32F3|nr:uncharacterized protein LOC122850878 [Aphidius gifuensis]